jgi:putative nucleotidyltransferase with HDIG domain
MFSLIRKIKRRIKRVLKVKAESRQGPPRSGYSRVRKIALLIIAAVLIAIFYPGEDLYDPLDIPRRGEVSLEDIIAPFEIIVYKTDRELEEEQEVVRRTVPAVLDADTTVPQQAKQGLRNYFSLVDSLRALPASNERGLDEYVAVVSQRFPHMPRGAIRESLTDTVSHEVVPVVDRLYENEIYKVGVLPNSAELENLPHKNVLIRRGDRENVYPRQRVLTAADANVELLSGLNIARRQDSIDVEFAYTVGRVFMEPNLRFNAEATAKRLEEELDAISNVEEVVAPGEIIVRSGARVDERQSRILDEMARMMRAQAAEQGPWMVFLPALARVALVLAALSLLYVLLYFYRREVYNSNPKLLAIFLVFGLQLFLISFVDRWDVSIYLFPVAVLPIVITILFDLEIGVICTMILALLLGLMHRFDFTLTLMTMTVGATACLTSRRVRHRTHFFRIALAVAAAYIGYIFLVENLKFVPSEEILVEVGYGAVNGLVSTLLTIGILPLFESLFGITTDITLLELSDMNHPLLKRLAIEAPGTYQHSMVVGNLCEQAAESIGANALLARVGAYYHDIGKIEIPEYFVENQLSVKSRHEDLSATMSSLILSSHVKRGRQLGEEHDIPDDVLSFIEEHHGTMLMSYFYNKAIEQGVDPETADKLRYPGPKPQRRETAIAMLADAVEAASRTLEDPKPARVDALIQRIINDRFQSGELNECPVTLRDLAKIKNAFAQVLMAAFHHRVVYPGQKEQEKSSG